MGTKWSKKRREKFEALKGLVEKPTKQPAVDIYKIRESGFRAGLFAAVEAILRELRDHI